MSATPTSPPQPSATQAYLVWWVGSGPGESAGILLYSYDPTTHLFTKLNSTTDRATVGYDADGNFQIQFAGSTVPVVQASSSAALNFQNSEEYQNSKPYRPGMKGLIVRGDISDLPPRQRLPQLQFFVLGQLVATVTPSGLYHAAFKEGDPALLAGKLFNLFADTTTLVASLTAGGTTAKDIVVES
jgi:hypothetical protein